MPDDDLQITEQDLICFFESAHVSRVYGDDWYDSDSVYEKKFDTGMTVTFALHPIHKDMRLCIFQGDKVIYDMQAVSVNDISYIKEKDTDCLKINLNATDWIEVKIKPELEIKQKSGSLT